MLSKVSALFFCAVFVQQASNLGVIHRSGQTFLTWNEASGLAGYDLLISSMESGSADSFGMA